MAQDQGVYKNCSLTVLGDPIEEESETDSGIGNVLGMTNLSDQVMDIEHLSQTAPPLEGLIVFNNGPNPDGIADIDLNRWQLVRVFARRDSEFPGARLPLKLDKPSPWLQSVHIQGYEITQQFMNTLAACPNLQRMFIIQSSPQRSPLRVPAPVNAANMVSFVFEGSGDDKVTDWRVPSCQLVCVVVRNTSISEIPPRMVEGMADSVILQADFSNNRITAEGAQPLRMFTAASGGLLELSANPIAELPPLPATADVCYHIPGGVFQKLCGCLHDDYKRLLKEMLDFDPGWVCEGPGLWFTEWEETWLECVPSDYFHTSLPVVLDSAHLRKIDYPQFVGRGDLAASKEQSKAFFTAPV